MSIFEFLLHIQSVYPMKLEEASNQLYERIRSLEAENEKLKKTELELTELNATKDKFLSIISHDLRNPVNTIVGLSEMLEKHVENKNFELVIEYAKYIRQSTHKIKDLLLNLFEWSISQSGMMEFNPTPHRLGSIIQEVVELSEEMLKQKEIKLDVQYLENDFVFIDREMIGTVIRNLLTNAIKFSYPGGKIKISCEKLEQNIVFSISDNGVGMSPEIQRSLFKIGETISSRGTKNETGTGIGLLLCKEFLDKHQTKILVESFAGKGSTFKFSLPLEKATEKQELS